LNDDGASVQMEDHQSCVCGGKQYRFDHVFGPKASQQNVFQQCVDPLVNRVIEGANACMFAFGQTGAGKTYTMIGPDGGRSEQSGSLPQAASSLLRKISRLEEGPSAPAFEVRLTFVEVFLNAAYDLLRKGDGDTTVRKNNLEPNERRPLKVRESQCGTVYAEGAQEVRVTSVRQLLKLVKVAAGRRTTKATGMHENSSRSHAILTLVLERRWVPDSSSPKDATSTKQYLSRTSRLVLVDLAGSENMDRSHNGDFDAAGCATNLGLVVLGRVIRARTEKSSDKNHIPYRDSVLTRLLQPCLMGDAEAVMMACVSSVCENEDQTLATLRFASVAKSVQLRPTLTKVTELEVNDPMANDIADPDETLDRRTVWIEVPGFGDVFARCLGPSSGPLVLYVHGSGSHNSSRFWNQVTMDMNRQVAKAKKWELGELYQVAIDCPGYGRSPGDKQTIRSYPAEFLEAVIRALGRKNAAAMVGSSQGSASIMNAALQKCRLVHALALVHPVTHAPEKFDRLKQPVLMFYDVNDPGHPVHVGRRLKKCLQCPKFFEFSSSKQGNWDAQQLPIELMSLLQAYIRESPKKNIQNKMGNATDKLPELLRIGGGLRSWTDRNGNEIDQFEFEGGSGFQFEGSDENVIEDEVIAQSSSVHQKIRPTLFEGHDEDSLSEDEDEKAERRFQEAQELKRRENAQEDCDLCGEILLDPIRLEGCRCALCGPCAEKWVRYMRDCPVCNSVMKRPKPSAFPNIDCQELKIQVENRLQAIAHGSSHPSKWLESAKAQSSRYLKCLDRNSNSTVVVLEYGNSTERCGSSKFTFDTRVRIVQTVNLKGGKKDTIIQKVSFNINPTYDKPTKVVNQPDRKGIFSFSYTMGRAFPCVVKVHFQDSIGVAPLEIDYCVQEAPCKRRIVLVLPANRTKKIPSKSVVEFTVASNPQNGWLKFESAISATQVDVNTPYSVADEVL